MDEQEFKTRADAALRDLFDALNEASARHEGFEADFNNGALAIEFEDPPAKFVVSPNTPVRQIWVSAHTKSFKLDWSPEKETFALPESGQTLKELIEWALSKQLNENVVL
ncbi:MAG: iron donor protein CyaY [Bryobacteraceae bacterium]|nr:iron donor protein CyaY [Bryobacteraceae bacterium]